MVSSTCFSGFVEAYGLDDFETSVDALSIYGLRQFEFAVADDQTLPEGIWHAQWAESDDEHQRRQLRLSSAPAVGNGLTGFPAGSDTGVTHPETLKHDSSEFVRRSVANNLNDIAKDHPQVVIDIARQWLGHNEIPKAGTACLPNLVEAGSSGGHGTG